MNENVLSPEFLINAYAQGYFPMPDPDTNEILWYRPDPRAIFPLNGFHVSHSLRKKLRKQIFSVTYDTCFKKVMLYCGDREETWINEDFIKAYTELHNLGFAHSIEVWFEEELVGGVYGVSINGAFFGESMFHRKTDASKVALYHLIEHLKQLNYTLLEVQFMTDHLRSLGAIEVNEKTYMTQLSSALEVSVKGFKTKTNHPLG